MSIETVGRTHPGCRRAVNEDAFLTRSDAGIWAVADGVGGHTAGDVASALVTQRLADCDAAGDLAARADGAERALLGANAALLELSRSAEAARTISTTVVALVAGADAFTCLWAGDSRAYLAREGRLAQLTKDHSLVQQLVDLGELDPAEAATHPNANIITRAVGGAAVLKVDRVSGDIRPGDVFLLATDGLTRLVSEAELAERLGAADLEAEADRLIDLCLARGAPDNVTFVILRAS
jgi:serine/threonine protein phosphatase PrpC